MKVKNIAVALFATIFFTGINAYSQSKITDPKVIAKLSKWQDIKFGMLIHYGLYSHLGIVESWSICSEEQDWIPRDSTVTYDAYKRNYWKTIEEFSPDRLDPESWARYGKQAGMKYVIFTTKHHDGFNMFDTKQSDFSIINGAFKNNSRANITKEVFDAFRKEDYMIGAYYSKADWHSQYYWWDRYSTPGRGVNYRVKDNPWRWGKFKEFCYNQLEELSNGDYGNIDIFWFDAGWVCPLSDADVARMGRGFKGPEDIDMPKIAKMLHKNQPGAILVDRSVGGDFEYYETPEKTIPEKQLSRPWESCIPLGMDWGHVPNDTYKSPAKVIHTLIEIVAKGGNLVLGIGPMADGTLHQEVTTRLEKIGEWMSKNGEAIYNTTIKPNYNDGLTWFTQSKSGEKVFAITLIEEGTPLPEKIIWKANEPAKGTNIILLETGKKVNWKQTTAGIEVTLPKGLNPDTPALAFSFSPAK